MNLHKMQVVLVKIRRYSDFALFSAFVLYSMENCVKALDFVDFIRLTGMECQIFAFPLSIT